MTQATTTAELVLSETDRQALELAVEIGRKLQPELIAHHLATKPWLEAAMDAAHLCQDKALHLKPWECWPPCCVEVEETDTRGMEHRGLTKSAQLLRKMLALGISRYHPDPIAALKAAERAA